jgi:hypothetical protein
MTLSRQFFGGLKRQYNLYFVAHTRTTWHYPGTILFYFKETIQLVFCYAHTRTTWHYPGQFCFIFKETIQLVLYLGYTYPARTQCFTYRFLKRKKTTEVIFQIMKQVKPQNPCNIPSF